MQPYVIAVSPKRDPEVRVTLQGPGIDPGGVPYVFATEARVELFLEAVNFAYQQGIEEGLRRASGTREQVDRSVVVVAGRHPESLVARRENSWERITRWWRESRLPN
jgi:hypothetical protein